VAVESFGSQLVVGNGSLAAPDQALFSPSITVGRLALVGDAQTNVLTNNGGFVRSRSPFVAASMPPLPLPHPATPGAGNIDVRSNHEVVLSPGSFGAVQVHGTLLLQPGTYSFGSINLDDYAKVLTAPGSVDVRISGSLTAGQRATFAPSNTTQPSETLTVSVLGNDASNLEAAAEIGAFSVLRGLFVVPYGRLALGNNTIATGALAAFDVSVGDQSILTFEGGFSSVGQQGQQQLTEGYLAPPYSTASVVGPVPATTPIRLAFSLPGQDPTGLIALADAVSDPTSPRFREYLAPGAFNAQYGATVADYAAIAQFASTNGLPVTGTFPDRLVLDVVAPASAVESALFVNMNYYLRPDGTQFFAPDRDPSLNTTVSVAGVSGLDDYVVSKTAQQTGSGYLGSFTGKDLRNAYLSATQSCLGLTGSGQSVGLFVGGGTYDPSDIAYFKTLQGSNTQVNFIPVDYGFSTLPPLTSGDCFLGGGGNADVELTLDMDMVIDMAPGIDNLNMFYSTLISPAETLDVLEAMTNTCADGSSTVANPTCQLTLSLSSSYYPGIDSQAATVFRAMAVKGQSFFVASGDYGIQSQNVGMNDIHAFSQITLVGATDLTMQSPGLAWLSEAPANLSGFASGGGILSAAGEPMPAYQQGVASAQNFASSRFRNFPDVAIVGQNIAAWCFGANDTVSGSSASAPLWAAFAALVNEQNAGRGAPPLGFANPLLYAIGTKSGPTAFHDVDSGNNCYPTDCAVANGTNGYPAVPGYDLVTGWGTPTCSLLQQLSCLTCTPGGGCIDLNTDEGNCGACEHSCIGGTCSSGQCQPVQLATVLGDSIGLATDGTNVYWTDQGVSNFGGLVQSVPVGGGSTVALASPVTVPVDLAIDTTNVFWSAGADPGGNAIFSVPKTGGAYGTVVTAAGLGSGGDAVWVAADGVNVYWAGIEGGVFQAPKSTGSPVITLDPVTAPPGIVFAIAVDASNVYWTEASPGAELLRKTPIGGGLVTTLASGLTLSVDVSDIATDGVNVYWTQGESGVSGGSVNSVSVNGGPTLTIATTSVTPGALAVDANYAYWVAGAQIQPGFRSIPASSRMTA